MFQRAVNTFYAPLMHFMVPQTWLIMNILLLNAAAAAKSFSHV